MEGFIARESGKQDGTVKIRYNLRYIQLGDSVKHLKGTRTSTSKTTRHRVSHTSFACCYNYSDSKLPVELVNDVCVRPNQGEVDSRFVAGRIKQDSTEDIRSHSLSWYNLNRSKTSPAGTGRADRSVTLVASDGSQLAAGNNKVGYSARPPCLESLRMNPFPMVRPRFGKLT